MGFSTFLNFFKATPFSSSKPYRHTQRANAYTELFNFGTNKALGPAIIIPSKVAQTIISLYAVSTEGTNTKEKILHTLEALLATVQLGLAITFLFKGEECKDLGNSLCKAYAFCSYVYTGILLVSVGAGEISKAPSNKAPTEMADSAEHQVLLMGDEAVENQQQTAAPSSSMN